MTEQLGFFLLFYDDFLVLISASNFPFCRSLFWLCVDIEVLLFNHRHDFRDTMVLLDVVFSHVLAVEGALAVWAHVRSTIENMQLQLFPAKKK